MRLPAARLETAPLFGKFNCKRNSASRNLKAAGLSNTLAPPCPRVLVVIRLAMGYSNRLSLRGPKQMPVIEKNKLKVLIRRAAIEKRVREVAKEISRDFTGERVHLIGVLKGACIFLSDLVREINLETSIDFIAVSSYGKGKESSGQVRVLKDLDSSIEGLNVVLVEDILDTGLTLSYLLRVLQQRKPKALRVAALLDKPSRRLKQVKGDYIGFSIPNEFVVGYGLDYGERYRNLKDVCVLKLPPEAR
jgi:hypoxanthine phosphoribosyltransferase